MLTNPVVRLIGRAVLVGVTSILVQIQSSTGAIVWHSILVAGVLAAAEVLTPLNSIVGLGKPVPPAKPAPLKPKLN